MTDKCMKKNKYSKYDIYMCLYIYRKLESGNNVWLLLPYLHKRSDTMGQRYQQCVEILERQKPHLHVQTREPVTGTSFDFVSFTNSLELNLFQAVGKLKQYI